MADSGSPAHETASLAGQPEASKRKIRKGTRSCWECKRRKNRCIWSRSEGKCDGCNRRGTRCIGQEFAQEPTPSEWRRVNRPDESRIQRLEALVEELSGKISSEDARGHHPRQHPDDTSDETHVTPRSNPNNSTAVTSPTPSAANNLANLRLRVLRNNITNAKPKITNASQPSLSRPPGGTSLGQFGDATGQRITPVVRALVSAWPGEHHYDDILKRKVVTSLHPALSSACSGYQFPPSPKDLLRLPPPDTTPVAIARKLLILGTYLQVLSSQPDHETTSPGSDYRLISTRALDTVSSLITHNDNLPQSIDIIECLIIESQYHNYMGNIRRAWTILRRAMAMAQLLGLDRQYKNLAQDTSTVDAEAGSRQENIWFLLVHFDQYVSLMLGTSPTLPESCQTAPVVLERCTRSGRMGRFHSMAAGRILQRNRINMYDVVETLEIDKIMQKAAACMPARWWLLSGWPEDFIGEECSCLELRLMTQFAHYNILLQLHLPFMLHYLHSQQHYYSTVAVINSSREILTRFTTFRSRHPSVSFCRGLDFFTFIASVALCLCHIHTSSESRIAGPYDGVGIADLLAHQRLTNRGLMEQALQSIEKIAQVESDDKLTSDIIPAFQKLLAVEEQAHEGTNYNIHLPFNIEPLKDSNSQNVADSSDSVYLELPFCGTIRIERASSSNNISPDVSNSGQAIGLSHIHMGSFPSLSEGYFATTFSALSASEYQDAMSAELYHFNKDQPHINSTYTLNNPSSDMQSMPYSGNASTSVPPGSEVMSDFEGGLNSTIDTGFLESLLDIQ
ncbi:hypothetical protein F5Y03DRAFT_409340 [Xylaria venustula]|nr:hypothetical protein F5Y03DRAFT_409340 [Xylaria venustula]